MAKVLKECTQEKAKAGKWFPHVVVQVDSDTLSISATDLISEYLEIPLDELEKVYKENEGVKCPRETADLQKDEWYFPTKASCSEVCRFIVDTFKSNQKQK